MAQVVLGVIGGVVGFYVGGPAGAVQGAQIGFAAGTVYEALTAEDVTQYGPRLEDRRLQVSTYGQNIGYAYGTVRLAGNVIWAADLEEVETSTEVGGKGGPSNTTITYSYFGSWAVLLCHGEIRGIRKIWADAVLIYDGSLDVPLNADVAFTLYRGTETQTADPTIEAAEGVGNVPAYRGVAYLVFTRMPLDRFGNRIPSISVEVTGDGEWTDDVTQLGETSAAQWLNAAQRMDGQVVAVSEPVSGTTRLSVMSPVTGVVSQTADHAIDVDATAVPLDQSSAAFIPPTSEMWVMQGDGVERYSADTLSHLGSVQTISSLGWSQTIMAYEPTSRSIVLHRASSAVGTDTVAASTIDGRLGTAGTGLLYARQLVTGGSSIFLACNSLNGFGYFAVPTGAGGVFGTELAGTVTTASGSIGLWDPLRRRYVVVGTLSGTPTVWTISDANPPTVAAYTPSGMFASSGPQESAYLAGLDVYVVMTSVSSNVIFTVLDAETLTVLLHNTDLTSADNLGITRVFADPDSVGSLFALGSYRPYQVDLYGTTVGSVVRHLCLQSDTLVSADVDVSDLSQRLSGYVVSQAGPVRAAIGQLAAVYAFDAVEEDDTIVFRARGGAAVAEITRDECGAGVDDRTADAITDVRAQELDLPRRLYLTAPDPATDHQPGTQYAERQSTRAGDDEMVSVATVLTATECRRTAMMMLFDRWASRHMLTFATTREYSALVPTDIITLDGRRVRITTKMDEGGLIRFEGVTDDPEVRDQTGLGVQGAFPGQEIAVQVPTNLVVLDIALLRDAEDHPGMYVAGYGIAPQWRGGVVYTSADEEVTWSRVAILPRPGSAIGEATTALGDFSGGNVFDEHNSVNISLANGSASSTTRLGVLNGGNALALESSTGWEVLQYRDATLEDDGTYTLTGLLRGRRGTEYAMAGHAVGDRVVLLDTGTIRDVEIDSSIIGIERPYRAVSVGDTIASTASQPETVEAERLYPWSPVLLGGGRNASLDVTLKWVRRTRVGGEWRDSVDASLGESSEEYTVRIYSSASYTTVLRTIGALSSPTTTYTAAQQVSDFGSTQSRVYWDVRQSSATVGLGHAARGVT